MFLLLLASLVWGHPSDGLPILRGPIKQRLLHFAFRAFGHRIHAVPSPAFLAHLVRVAGGERRGATLDGAVSSIVLVGAGDDGADALEDGGELHGGGRLGSCGDIGKRDVLAIVRVHPKIRTSTRRRDLEQTGRESD